MKSLLAVLAAGLLCACAGTTKLPSVQPIKASISGAQTHTTAATQHVSVARKQVTAAQGIAKQAQSKVANLEKIVAKQAEALSIAQGLRTDIDTLSRELIETQVALTHADDELGATSKALAEAQLRADEVQKKLDNAQASINKALDTEKKYHKLKWGCVLIGTVLVAGLMASMWKFLLPLGWLGLGIGVGVPAAVGVFLSLKL